jgi:hypothetical protein
MDKESKKALDDKYGIPDDVEDFAAKIAAKEDNPTMHELAKAFPEKTYKELEAYRNSDRQEEANQIPLTEAQRDLVEHLEAAVGKNKTRQAALLTESQKKQEELEPLEGEEQDNPTLWEIAKEHNVSYADAVPIQEDMRLKRDALKAACTLAEMRKDRTPLELMKKRAEEAEGELSIMKGIETNRVKEAQEALANALEVNESHQRLNGKLQVRMAELEDENKALHKHVDKQIEAARKAGL